MAITEADVKGYLATGDSVHTTKFGPLFQLPGVEDGCVVVERHFADTDKEKDVVVLMRRDFWGRLCASYLVAWRESGELLEVTEVAITRDEAQERNVLHVFFNRKQLNGVKKECEEHKEHLD